MDPSRERGRRHRFVLRCARFGSALAAAMMMAVEAYSLPAVGSSLDQEGGFRDAKLGAPRSSFRGLVKEHTHQGIDYYTRPGDTLSFGGVRLETILYGFSGGLLDRIQLVSSKRLASTRCEDRAEFHALAKAVEAYNDVSYAGESDPGLPRDPLVDECLAGTRAYDCVVLVYQARKIQVHLRAVLNDPQEETSRQVLTSEQLSDSLRKVDARPLGAQTGATPGGTPTEHEAMKEALAVVIEARLRRLGAPEGAAFYEGRDGITIAVAKLPEGRFDVITLKDMSPCYHVVAFSLVPPPEVRQ